MSARSLELQSLRRELRAGQDLLEQLEARIAALRAGGASSSLTPCLEPRSRLPRRPSPDQVEGISPGVLSSRLCLVQEEVSSPRHRRKFLLCPALPLAGQGQAGVDLGLALDLEDTFLTEAPEPIQGLQPLVQDCCCSGGRAVFEVSAGRRTFEVLGTERSELELLVLCDFQGRRCAEPCIFSSFGPCKNLCCRGPDKGRSIFVGLPPQTEVAEALRAADLSWPSEGLDVQPRWV